MNGKIKGTKDYFGREEKNLNKIFSLLEEISIKYSYNQIITPTIEYTELFSRSIGENADVINKEMYTFLDRKGRSLSLRPEGTASTVRAALENNLFDNNNKPLFHYISPMFRYERPQKGRQREFYQFGVENFGRDCPYVDVEIISIAIEILKELRVNKYELHINTIGDSQSRKEYNKALTNFVKNNINDFSEYAKEKFNNNNVLRIFDSKKESDLLILKDAPKLKDFLSKESLKRFQEIKRILDKQKIKYKENDFLVRGLDYYNDLVFEFISTDLNNLGTKSTIIGGGRYDSLVNKLDDSKNVYAIGFALGIERLMLASKDYLETQTYNNINYYIAPLNEEYNLLSISIAKKLRDKNINVFVDYENRKLLKKIETANKLMAEKIIIIGDESNNGIVTIKDLKTGDQKQINIKEI